MKRELYEKVFINSEEDYPKNGIYIVKCADNDTPEFMKMCDSGNIFWHKVAWYLRLVPEVTDKEIEKWAESIYSKTFGAKYIQLLIKGAKAMRDDKIC